MVCCTDIKRTKRENASMPDILFKLAFVLIAGVIILFSYPLRLFKPINTWWLCLSHFNKEFLKDVRIKMEGLNMIK